MPVSLKELDWDSHREETMRILRALIDFTKTMEAQLSLARKRDLARIRKGFGPVRRRELQRVYGGQSGYVSVKLAEKYGEHKNHAMRFEDSLPTQLRYSIVMFLYIVFEARSRAMCDELMRRRPQTIRRPVKDYIERGPGKDGLGCLKGVRRFLEIEASVKITDSKIWGDIVCLGKARHCIAHANGLVKDAPPHVRKPLEQLARRGLGFDIGEDGYARIEAPFCRRMQTQVHRFFKETFDLAHFGPERMRFISISKAHHDPYFQERHPKWYSEEVISVN